MRRLQFSLRSLLLFVTVVAVCLGVGKMLFTYLATSAQDRARSGKSGANLTSIYGALEHYHYKHGCYPPAFIPDKEGKPMHSWRVLLLPYLGRDDLWARYDFSEPWNGPNNIKLAKEMPESYWSPFEERDCGCTSYLAVTGEEAAWPGPVSRSKCTFPLPRPTVLVVDVSDSGICWLEPRDLPLEEALRALDDSSNGLKLRRSRTGHFQFASTRYVRPKEDMSAEEWRSLLFCRPIGQAAQGISPNKNAGDRSRPDEKDNGVKKE